MKHVHKAIEDRAEIVGWTHCVARGNCSGMAHGGVTHIDYCRCGAIRKIESNGCTSMSSGWYMPYEVSEGPPHDAATATGMYDHF